MSTPWRSIRQNIQTHAPSYVCAVSGGVDSMFLLDFISKCNVKFHVAHVNHGLRPEAIDEEHLVRTTAERLNVGYSTITLSGLEKAKSIEAEAREQRYAFLRQVKMDLGYEKIITAHHLNDQVETILLRLMRGLPHDSLGMKPDNGDVFRPFLEVPKETILRNATRRGIIWLEDASNASLDFERNWVRNSLIPQMLERRNVLKTIPHGLPNGSK